MVFLIDISDKRNVYVLEGLKNLGFKAFNMQEISEETMDNAKAVYVFSPAKKLIDEINQLKNNSFVIGGNQKNEVLESLKQKNIEYINIMQNEIFTIENAKLTAEGVLAIIIGCTEKSIFCNNILVLGSGRCGKTVMLLLDKLGVKATLCTFHKDSYENAHLLTDNVMFKDQLEDRIGEFDIIINTVPLEIITEKMLENIKRGVMVIEVASVNCISHKLKEKYNLNYILAPALPKVYSAQSAGEIMLKHILKHFN